MNCCYNENIENIIVICNKTNGENTKYINSIGKEVNIDGYIFFYAKRDIQKGEELLYNYGPEYQEKLGIKM
jgi:SET domain-containing protein